MVMIVTLAGASALDTLAIVHELEQQGIMRDRDFTFEYHHTEYSDGFGAPITPRYAEFTFRDDTNGIWFQLKYG
jgi:hypothetical protein